jgi:hypothetical protein
MVSIRAPHEIVDFFAYALKATYVSVATIIAPRKQCMSTKKLVLMLILLLWVTGVAGGFVIIVRYEGTAGVSGQAPTNLAEMPQTNGRKLVILLAHPRCPCTRATLSEFEKIITRRQDRVAAHVYFFQPIDRPSSWSQGESWDLAARLPGVQVHADVDGRMAKKLGAKTSGQVVVFDETGRLLFDGGITGARGHQGDNPGCQAVLDLLQGISGSVHDFPVFGCPLFDPQSPCCEGVPSCRN